MADDVASEPVRSEKKNKVKYEYSAVGISFHRDFNKLNSQINKLCEDGWEVVQLEWQNGHDHALLLLQRERPTGGDA